MIVYPSTASLLRRISGESDEMLKISINTLEDERRRQPNSAALANCNGASEFCVTIATFLPLSLIGRGPDSVLTQSLTCLKLPDFSSLPPGLLPPLPPAAPPSSPVEK